MFKTLLANVSISFSVSPGATAAKTKTPLPMEDISSFSTVTDADKTRWNIARAVANKYTTLCDDIGLDNYLS